MGMVKTLLQSFLLTTLHFSNINSNHTELSSFGYHVLIFRMKSMDCCGDRTIESAGSSSDLIGSNEFSIWAIYKGIMVKVPNVDRHKRPAIRFRQMDVILEREHKGNTWERSDPPQHGYRLRSSNAISSPVSYTSPSKTEGTHPSEIIINKVKDADDGCRGDENSVDNDEIIFSNLTLKEIQKMQKARVGGVSVPDDTPESSGSNSSGGSDINGGGRGIKHPCWQKDEDDPDLHDTLGGWRVTVSGRMPRTRRKCVSPKQVSFPERTIPAEFNGEHPTIFNCDADTVVAIDELDLSTISCQDCVSSVSTEYLSAVEVKTEVPYSYHSERRNVIVGNQKQNYLCCQPLKLNDPVTRSGATRRRGPYTRARKRSEVDASNRVERSADASPDTLHESTGHAFSISASDIILLEKEMISLLRTKKTSTETHDAPIYVGHECLEEMVSANDAMCSIVNMVDYNLAKSPEDLKINHVNPIREQANRELDAICTTQYSHISMSDTDINFSAKINAAEDLPEFGSDEALSSEFLEVQASTDTNNQQIPSHNFPDRIFGCHDIQQAKMTTCEPGAKSLEGLSRTEDASCGCLLMDVAESEAKRKMIGPFLYKKKRSRPREFFVKRKVISPTSQEKLCQAMDAENLCYRIAPPLVCADDVETLPKAALKTAAADFCTTNDVGASFIDSCACGACVSNSLYAQKAIEFSQRQMHDIECLASKLLRELKSLKGIVEDNLLSESCLLPLDDRTDELKNVVNTASEAEETARKWLYMMSRDCNRFCKIMKIKEKSGKSGRTEEKREQRRITFADESGGLLCHVKIFQDDSFP